MNSAKTGFILILFAILLSIALRVPKLDDRPMHTDEAVHADKFRMLLEEHHWEYDPVEYHGPTLNYLTLIPTLLRGVGTYINVTEFDLRIIPVFFGVMLVFFLLVMGDGIGWIPAAIAGFLTAISPVMVFFSRYYIQEILLVSFTMGVISCGYRYMMTKRLLWLLSTGVFLGLMNATKETCIISYGSMFVSLLIVLLINKGKDHTEVAYIKSLNFKHICIFILVALAVSCIFYSSFFSNPKGIVDSVATYQEYFKKSGGSGIHDHHWNYYLKLIGWYQFEDNQSDIKGPLYTELAVMVLALIGFIFAFIKKRSVEYNISFVRFIALYTIFMTVIYSFIPYKTPWCLLGFYHGMILLAGFGAYHLLSMKPKIYAVIAGCLIFAGSVHLAWQTYTSNYLYNADSRNPYVYAHTTKDIYTIVQRIRDVARVHQDGKKMDIQVYCPSDDYWPLPWYLRDFEKVQFRALIHQDTPMAPVVLFQPPLEDAFRVKYNARPSGQRDLYVNLYEDLGIMELRPTIEILGYFKYSLWQKEDYVENDPDEIINSSQKQKEKESP